MINKLLALLAIAFSAAGMPGAAASPVTTPHVQAELVARHESVRPGRPAEIALRLKIIDHWHTYWQNPGDSGLPTRLTWSLPAGYTTGPIQWPYPKKLPLGPLMNFGYEGEVLHLVQLDVPATAKAGVPVTLRAKAEWLVCSDVCIPESADLELTLPVVAADARVDPRWADAFAKAHAALPKPLNASQVSAKVSGGQFSIELTFAAAQSTSLEEVSFFPLHENLIANAAKQNWARTDTGYRLVTAAADPVDDKRAIVEGVLVSPKGWGDPTLGQAVSFSAPLRVDQSAAGSASVAASGDAVPAIASGNQLGLLMALLFAFIGGTILNLMPCVFPVLGLKIMNFARHAQSEPQRLRKQGGAFFVGVLVSFWILAGVILAIRAAGESIGWGFQLQSPAFVTLLAMLFMAMALNLSGVFEIGLGLQTAAGNIEMAGSRGELRDAFLSGALATIVATPCTAPMMGAALGYTLSQPAHVAFLVFTAIAVGMATPVLALSFSPALLKRIPRPGAWMNTFKQLMAFPLFATVAWLAWVLGSQTGNDGSAKLLFGLVAVALAAWSYGHWQVARPKLAVFLAALFGALALFVSWPGAQPIVGKTSVAAADWIPYSRQKLAELRAQGQPVFIDFTATWCITCQVNKRVALNDDAVIRRFGELAIVRMKADWTLQDPEITRALAEFGRNGVPLYVFYPRQGQAKVLPEILTPSLVLEAISTSSAAATSQR